MSAKPRPTRPPAILHADRKAKKKNTGGSDSRVRELEEEVKNLQLRADKIETILFKFTEALYFDGYHP